MINLKNIDDEYRKAFWRAKNGNYETVLVEANKSFESTKYLWFKRLWTTK